MSIMTLLKGTRESVTKARIAPNLHSASQSTSIILPMLGGRSHSAIFTVSGRFRSRPRRDAALPLPRLGADGGPME